MAITAFCVAVSHHIDDCNDLNQPTHQEEDGGEDGGDTHKVGFQIPNCKSYNINPLLPKYMDDIYIYIYIYFHSCIITF
jgi:hypothetical protein